MEAAVHTGAKLCTQNIYAALVMFARCQAQWLGLPLLCLIPPVPFLLKTVLQCYY